MKCFVTLFHKINTKLLLKIINDRSNTKYSMCNNNNGNNNTLYKIIIIKYNNNKCNPIVYTR